MLNCELESAFEELMMRIENVFASELGCKSAKKYLTGLISPVERKNGWQLSEALGETTPMSCNSFYTEADSAPMHCGTNYKCMQMKN
jgi:SRSO17 transposase